MGAYSTRLTETLNKLAYEWADKIRQTVTELLSKPQYRNTGASLASLKVTVHEGNADKAAEVVVEFADSLNLVNLRKMQWTGQPPVDDFIQWAETRHLKGPVPGYKDGTATDLPPWKQMQRKVWAIVMSKKKFDKWKPKPWRKKSLGNVLKELNEEMLKSFDEAIQKDFEDAIKQAR